MSFYIYKISNQIDGKVYIGKTNNPKRRLVEHFCKAKKGSSLLPKLYSAIRKYGKESFTIETIAEFLDEAEAYKAEEEYISRYNSFTEGYNCNKGGGSPGNYWTGKPRSIETRKKLSEYRTGTRHSAATLEALSKSHQGNKNAAVISDADVGHIFSLWLQVPEEDRNVHGAKAKFYKERVQGYYPIELGTFYNILNGSRSSISVLV